MWLNFQKRNPKELLTEEEYNAPHPEPRNAYGKTYGEHREYLEFSIEQHKELKRYAEKELNIVYSTSVWDMTSLKEIISINPKILKHLQLCLPTGKCMSIYAIAIMGKFIYPLE